MRAPHPAGSAVHRGYSWPGLEKVSNLMGDGSDADGAAAARNARLVEDVKVGFWFFFIFLQWKNYIGLCGQTK